MLKDEHKLPVDVRGSKTSVLKFSIAVHVRYKSLYISLPSSAKQQREMSKFCVVYGTWTTTDNFSYFHLVLNAAIARLAKNRFLSHFLIVS